MAFVKKFNRSLMKILKLIVVVFPISLIGCGGGGSCDANKILFGSVFESKCISQNNIQIVDENNQAFDNAKRSVIRNSVFLTNSFIVNSTP